MSPLPLSVLSWNIYLGADVTRVIGAPPGELPQRMSGLWAMVQQTDFTARARALAAEIVRRAPDVVSLQEVYRWSVARADGTGERVHYDFLALLVRALAKAGITYDVAVRSFGVNVSLPTAEGPRVRLEDSVALLVRRGESPRAWSWSTPRQARFGRNLRVTLDAEPFDIARGWASVDLHRGGRTVRVIGAHLEYFSAEVQPAQIDDLLTVPAAIGGPVVIAGDFNSRPGSPAWKRLHEAGFVDAWEQAGEGPGFTSSNDEDVRNPERTAWERIDWVLARGALRPRKAELVGADPDCRTTRGLWPSDHAGVSVVFAPDQAEPARPPRPSPMPKPQTPLAVVRAVYDCFTKGDVPGVLQLLHPDARFHFPGDPKVLPWAGDYRGAGMMKFFLCVGETLTYLENRAHTFHVAGDVVTVLSHERCKVKATGRIFDNDLVAVITVRDGRVADFVEFSDTAAMQAAFVT